jgi:hypothetical protein
MTGEPLALTVAIKCHRDRRLFALLDSIDENVDTVVLFASGDPLDAAVRARGVRCTVVDSNDIGRRCNAALLEAHHDRTVFLDADCVLEPGALRRLARAMDDDPVVRARLEFRPGSHRTSRAIARWRQFENHVEPTPAFMPGLGLRVPELEERLGSRLTFEEGIPAAIDAALDDRLRGAGILTVLVDDAVLIHDETRLGHFLRAGFRTGVGTAQLVLRGRRPHHERLVWAVTRALRLAQLRTFAAWVRGAGADGAILGVAWTMSYRVGFHSEMWRR